MCKMKNNSCKWQLHHDIPTRGHGEDYASGDTTDVTTIIILSRRIVLIAAGEILPLASSLQYTPSETEMRLRSRCPRTPLTDLHFWCRSTAAL